METKNIILTNYATSIQNAATTIFDTCGNLNENLDENLATIKTLNVLVESLRSQTIILQDTIDNYNN